MKNSKLFIVLIVFAFAMPTVFSQNNPEEKADSIATTKANSATTRIFAYIDKYKAIAQETMIKYKIPASITLAQALLESGFGLGTLAQQANNHFGIKCHDWSGETISYDDDTKQECFRKYKNPEESYRDHAGFLSKRSRYATLFNLPQGDYKGWAKGLKAAGYATDCNYAIKLIRLVEEFHLDQYDNL